jgi:hypothetical protein
MQSKYAEKLTARERGSAINKMFAGLERARADYFCAGTRETLYHFPK